MKVFVPSFQDAVIDRLFVSMENSEPNSVAGVVVLDNGLTDAVKTMWPQVHYLSVPRPFVAAQAFNRGFAAYPQDDVVVICDDAEIGTLDWKSRIDNLFRSWPAEYGLVTFAEPAFVEVNGLPPLLRPHEMTVISMASGIAIPRRVLEQVGPWEEALVGYGFDDFDYGLRLLHAGYRMGVSGEVLLRVARQAAGWEKVLGSWEAVLAHADVNFEVYLKKWLGWVPPKPWVVQLPITAEHLSRRACTCRDADWKKP